MKKITKKNSGIWNFFLLGGNIQNSYQIYALLSTVSSVLVGRPCWQIRKNKKTHFWKNLYLWADNQASTQGYSSTKRIPKMQKTPSAGILPKENFLILNRNFYASVRIFSNPHAYFLKSTPPPSPLFYAHKNERKNRKSPKILAN